MGNRPVDEIWTRWVFEIEQRDREVLILKRQSLKGNEWVAQCEICKRIIGEDEVIYIPEYSTKSRATILVPPLCSRSCLKKFRRQIRNPAVYYHYLADSFGKALLMLYNAYKEEKEANEP